MKEAIRWTRGCNLRAGVGVFAVTATLLLPHGAAPQSGGSLELEARVLGDGPPVVLLGGGLLGAESWGDVPPLLARSHKVINLQSLVVQYGLENRPLPDGYSIQTEVDALRTTLAGMGIPAADVIGMSHGGVTALVFALQHPERVTTLTLIEPPAFWLLPNHGLDDEGARGMQTFIKSLRDKPIGDADVERFRCLLGDCRQGRSPREARQWPQWVKHRNSLRGLYTIGDYADDPARLRRLTMPALIVTGAETVAFHRQINEALIHALPNAEGLQLTGGHNSPVGAPDQFVADWQKFRRAATRTRR